MTKAGPRLEKVMRRKELDAILFWGLENVRYLCGFTGSDGTLIWAKEGRVFLTDSRYTEQAKTEVKNASFRNTGRRFRNQPDPENPPGPTNRVRSGGRKFRKLPPASGKTSPRFLRPFGEEFSGLRAVKDAEEIARLKTAVRIASESFGKTTRQMRAGFRETAIAESLECQFRRRGGETRLRYDRGFRLSGRLAAWLGLAKEIGRGRDRGHRFRGPVPGVSFR